jgi:hypothetical protein
MDWKERVEMVEKKMRELSMPSSPDLFGKEYKFPEASTGIKTEDLGNWLMKLSSWKGYTIRLLARADIERIIIDESVDIAVAKSLSAELKAGKKVTKDAVLGAMILDEKFRELRTRLIEKKAECASLKMVIDIYSTQLDAISREISRRGQELQVMGKNL